MLTTALGAGISPETLRKIETGRVATPAFSTIAAVASVLELSLDDVWAAVKDPTSTAQEIRPGSPEGTRLAS